MGSTTVNVGDSLVALVDNPGNTDSNWVIMESNRDQATETVKGVARIATASEVSAGTDDTTIVTPAKLATVTKSAGAGLTDISNVFDVVAADASLVVNADDMAVQVGNTNGTSLETTATGVELTSTVTGDRTFSSDNFTVSSNTKAEIGAPADGAVLTNQPSASVDLAIATTKFVNDALSAVTEVFNELPSVTDGSADVTLANTPIAGTERVYLNGSRMVNGSSADFTISGSTITFNYNLQNGDIVVTDYKY